MKESSCCFTGHRKIAEEIRDELKQRLTHSINMLHIGGIVTFYTGGALGFDTLAAEAIIRYRLEHPDVRFILALPCKNQTHHWKTNDIERYEAIRESANETVYVSQKYDPGCMQRRNKYMVDHSAICVCYQTKEKGGTANTVSYAAKQGLRIINIANAFQSKD